MGTAISVELWCDDAGEGAAAAEAVMCEMHRIDRLMSPHKPTSELSRINREAAAQAVPLGAEMLQLLQRALAFSRLTHGAFDISYAAAGHLYDYRAGTAPDSAALRAAQAAIGWQYLDLDLRAGTLRFGRPGMRIDLGGFAKGHAVDRAAALLQQRGVQHAYIAAGGDSRVIGDRRGRPWTIAIRNPRVAAAGAAGSLGAAGAAGAMGMGASAGAGPQADAVVAVLPLEDTAISTSGDYERCFVRDGVRHHHLIDPATGRSATRLRSATVLAPDGLTSEALGKALFVLGAADGLALLATLPGVDAVLIDAHGALHFSAGLMQAAVPAQARSETTPRSHA